MKEKNAWYEPSMEIQFIINKGVKQACKLILLFELIW